MLLTDRDARAVYTTTQSTYRCQPVEALREFLTVNGYPEDVVTPRPAVYETHREEQPPKIVLTPAIPEEFEYRDDPNNPGEQIRVITKEAIPRRTEQAQPDLVTKTLVSEAYHPPTFTLEYTPPPRPSKPEKVLTAEQEDLARAKFIGSSCSTADLAATFGVTDAAMRDIVGL